MFLYSFSIEGLAVREPPFAISPTPYIDCGEMARCILPYSQMAKLYGKMTRWRNVY